MFNKAEKSNAVLSLYVRNSLAIMTDVHKCYKVVPPFKHYFITMVYIPKNNYNLPSSQFLPENPDGH